METNNINPENDEYPFTTGPWESHIIYSGTETKNTNENFIAKVNWFPYDGKRGNEIAIGKANANLIAAGLDLLQAAQAALDALSISGSDTTLAIIALTKAIKKAYGR